MANDRDKGAVQHADSAGDRLDKGAVEFSAVAVLTVTEETFQNYEPFDNDESIGTAQATGGSVPYTWEIISQDLL